MNRRADDNAGVWLLLIIVFGLCWLLNGGAGDGRTCIEYRAVSHYDVECVRYAP